MNVKPYDVAFKVGQRVHVEIPGIKYRQPGTIVGMRTKFAKTPAMRRIICVIWLDHKVYGSWKISVHQEQCHLIYSEAEA